MVGLAEEAMTLQAIVLLEFPAVSGDCHVKAGYVDGSPYFMVNLAPYRGMAGATTTGCRWPT
jgi:hypothetical protein